MRIYSYNIKLTEGNGKCKRKRLISGKKTVIYEGIQKGKNRGERELFRFVRGQDRTMTDRTQIKDGDKSFSKLFDLIELVARSRSGLKGREIAEACGFPTSTTFRMLKFLVEKGYLRSSGSRYSLGLGLARLGNLAAAQNPLLKISRPLLAELSAKTMETVHLAELKDECILYVDKVEGVRPVRMGSLIGNCSPLYCTGIGKAILAFLPELQIEELCRKIRFVPFTEQTIRTPDALKRELTEIRKRGYAVDNCEHERGVYCLAAPVLNYAGTAVAGISVSGSELYLRDKTDEFARLVKETAEKISSEYHG